MNRFILNIAGKKYQDKTGKKRARRALDGMGIASHSKFHLDRVHKKLENENIDENIKDKVMEHVRSEVANFYDNDDKKQKYLEQYQDENTCENLYNKLCQERQVGADDKRADTEKEDIRKVFNALKEEANIVATSHAPLLWIGKKTSRLSQAPLLGAAIAGMNNIIRKIPGLGKSLGDLDANNPDTMKDKGETVFTVSLSAPERVEERREDRAPDRAPDRVKEHRGDIDSKADTKTFTLEERSAIIAKCDIAEMRSLFENKAQTFSDGELQGYAQHENPSVRQNFALYYHNIDTAMIEKLLNVENLNITDSDFNTKNDAKNRIGEAIVLGQEGEREFDQETINRFLESRYYPMSRALVRLKKKQLGADNIDKLLQRCDEQKFDTHVYSNGQKITPHLASERVLEDLASGCQDLTPQQFQKVYDCIGQGSPEKFLLSPRPLTPNQRKLFSHHRDCAVRMGYFKKHLESVTQSFKDLDKILTECKESQSGVLPKDIEDYMHRIKDNIDAYNESWPRNGPMRDESFPLLNSELNAFIQLANKVYQNDVLKKSSSLYKTDLIQSLRKWGEQSIILDLQNFPKL